MAYYTIFVLNFMTHNFVLYRKINYVDKKLAKYKKNAHNITIAVIYLFIYLYKDTLSFDIRSRALIQLTTSKFLQSVTF